MALSASQNVLNELRELCPSPTNSPPLENDNQAAFTFSKALQTLDLQELSSPTKKSRPQQLPSNNNYSVHFDFVFDENDHEHDEREREHDENDDPSQSSIINMNITPQNFNNNARSAAKAWLKNLSTTSSHHTPQAVDQDIDSDDLTSFSTPLTQLKTIRNFRLESDQKDAQNYSLINRQSGHLATQSQQLKALQATVAEMRERGDRERREHEAKTEELQVRKGGGKGGGGGGGINFVDKNKTPPPQNFPLNYREN